MLDHAATATALQPAVSDFAEALDHMREGEKFAMEGTKIPASWPALNGLGLVEYRRGRYARADQLLQEALKQAQACSAQGLTHDAYVDLAGCLNDLAVNSIALGKFDNAKKHFGRATYLAERAYRPDLRTISCLRSNQAMLCLLQRDVPMASHWIGLALECGGTGDQLREEAGVSMALKAEIHLANGDVDLALEEVGNAAGRLAPGVWAVEKAMLQVTKAGAMHLGGDPGAHEAAEVALEVLQEAYGEGHPLNQLGEIALAVCSDAGAPTGTLSDAEGLCGLLIGGGAGVSRVAGLHMRHGEALRRLYGDAYSGEA